MRVARILGRLGVAVAMLVSLTVLAGTSAEAAASCYRGSCTGKWPDSTGCSSDAKTVTIDNQLVTSPPFAGMRLTAPTLRGGADVVDVEMRYSPVCRATWARLYSRGGSGFHGYLSVWIDGQPSQQTFITSGGGGNWYTPMVDGGVRNCFGMQIYQEGVWRAWRQAYCV